MTDEEQNKYISKLLKLGIDEITEEDE